ncbi:MarR family transcriptional regulator [Sphingobium cupriresistens LL01]|uniref:MarR family transcriptional regulator n=2 Tax=Sphingomonadaceae TaxID=41297 RepID=A0A0J7XJF6_9SPHN|nr:MarR family transcriptional regulator [Sphingobium cupriresistens LL01]MBJ7375948.1 winged helix-turn-helix transcriptional regulator [Sphingobium sp.]
MSYRKTMSNSSPLRKPSASSKSPRPRAAEASPADTLHRVLRLANKLMAPFSTYLEHRYKISLNEFRLLMLIGRHPNSASHELAEMTGVNPMSVSRAVAALQKHGRIAVERDPGNKRRKTLILTDEGQRLYGLMRPQTDKVATYLVSALAGQEVDMLNQYLDTLVDTLEATDDSGNSRFLEFTRPDGDDEPTA